MKKLLGIIVCITGVFSLGFSTTTANGGFGISHRVEDINVPQTDSQNVDDKALVIVTEVADWILSLTSLVAIIVFLIGGYKVLTAGGDDGKAKSGYKFIKNALIGLLIIGLTRAIVRLIFRFVGGMAGDHDFDTDT